MANKTKKQKQDLTCSYDLLKTWLFVFFKHLPQTKTYLLKRCKDQSEHAAKRSSCTQPVVDSEASPYRSFEVMLAYSYLLIVIATKLYLEN